MFYDIFTKSCAEKGMSPTATLQKMNISTSKLTAWKKGSVPNGTILILISEFFGVTVDYLLTGKEPTPSSFAFNNEEQELLNIFKELSEKDKGRILGYAQALSDAFKKPMKKAKNTIFIETYLLPVSAGTGVFLDNCDREMIEVEETSLTLEANFALRVSGDSMEPDFQNGDVLLIRSQPTVEVGEIGIFILNGEGYVKEFGGDCLISHNKKYENIKLNEYSELYCRGLVLGVL